MPFRFCHAGDFHLDEDRYFADTAQCLEWFVADAMQSHTNLFVVNGDLTTYKATIKERNVWVDMLIRMANHAPVLLVAGNHGAELDDDFMSWRRPRALTPFFYARNRNSSSLTMLRLQYFLIRARQGSSGARRKANFPMPS